jgi:hypothetical protein
MRIAKLISTAVGMVALVALSAAQTPQLKGTARENSGTPLNGVRVTVKKDNMVVAQTTTNSTGAFITKAAFGAVSVECEAISDSVYAKNPVSYQVEIGLKSNPGTQNCTFYPVTVQSAYWYQAGKAIEATAYKTKDEGTFNVEWQHINASGLPPAAKAAAAHELKHMDWSSKITDPTFRDYMVVDDSTLSRALKGDQKAVALLPQSVAVDVKGQSGKQ